MLTPNSEYMNFKVMEQNKKYIYFIIFLPTVNVTVACNKNKGEHQNFLCIYCVDMTLYVSIYMFPQ